MKITLYRREEGVNHEAAVFSQSAMSKFAIVAGNSNKLDAKMGGITPAVFTRSGKCVDWPPYIFRPTWRLAYWMGMRRWARSMKTTPMSTATIKITRARAMNRLMSPSLMSWKDFTRAPGMPTTIPEKIIREIPLPIPFSVICSPSHMMSTVPAVRVSMVMMRKVQPGSRTTGTPPGLYMVSRPTAMPKP